MKVVILAGGLGTRISEYTKTIPKPMIKVCGKPIIQRKSIIIINMDSISILRSYKGQVIKIILKKKLNKDLKINLIETGRNTMTGGRLKKLKKFLDKTFLLTYGDGLSNLNLRKLVKFHKENKKLITLTAVRPPARFGVIKIKGKIVQYFREKNSLDAGWINGGFCEPNL